MTFFTSQKRVWIKPIDDFAYIQRNVLKIQNSALIIGDTNIRKAYIGFDAKKNIFDPTTNTNAIAEEYSLPLDWRLTGISLLNQYGISTDIQVNMMDKFVKDYTLEQRRYYVNMFTAIDPNDTVAVSNFINQMITMLAAS